MKIQANEIEIVSIDSLIPHEKNMHSHDNGQIERLIKLIEYQGMRNPLIVQKGTNKIVAGHGRALALKKMGEKKVPVIYQEFESESQLYAYMVSDNAIGKDTWASLDLSVINLEVISFDFDFDFDLLGLKQFSISSEEKSEFDKILKEDMNKKFILEITFPNEMELADIRDDLTSRGYMVKEK